VSATTDLVSETRPSPTAGASYFSTVILFGRANKPGNALSSFCDRIAPLLILDQQLIYSSPIETLMLPRYDEVCSKCYARY
jgi:hypothetical protein